MTLHWSASLRRSQRVFIGPLTRSLASVSVSSLVSFSLEKVMRSHWSLTWNIASARDSSLVSFSVKIAMKSYWSASPGTWRVSLPPHWSASPRGRRPARTCSASRSRSGPWRKVPLKKKQNYHRSFEKCNKRIEFFCSREEKLMKNNRHL